MTGAVQIQTLMAAAERLGIQVPRARQGNLQKPNDLAREAVSWYAVLGAAAWLAPIVSRVRITRICRSDIAELIVHFVRSHLIED